ncbi:MAG TPA: O-antigen ligase family protein [Chitinophagaceae bacterium]|nr:O-antigen ligase family protein [Chitinophagaceae bacterium]
MAIYYIILFFSSLLLADIGVIPILQVGNTSAYIIDLVFAFFFWCLAVISLRTKLQFPDISKWYLGLIAILFLSIGYGITKFGFSALGEGRYIYWLLFFAVPVYFYYSGQVSSFRDFEKMFKLSWLLVTVTVLVLLGAELLYGGRFFMAAANQENLKLEDDRGIRYLGSEETFHLGTAVIFMIFMQYGQKRKGPLIPVLILLLTAIILFTKNRAAFLSLAIALVIVLIQQGKFKQMLKLASLGTGLLMLTFMLFPAIVQPVITPIQSAFDITADETGSWRLMIQAIAIEQGLQSPLFGQGFGGYFEYYIEALNETVNYPPHSIYIHLFQKTGLIGVIAYIAAIVSLIRQNSLLKNYSGLIDSAEPYRLCLRVILIAQVFYGFAYNFSVYLGLYIGLQTVLLKILKNKQAALSASQYGT